MSELSRSVHIYVASLNTAAATELCIRSARRLAGFPMQLTVGDSGSTDGSLALLRDFEAKGWLDLQVAPSGRHHSSWLDHWLSTCTADYAVFVDSDIDFRRHGWLRQLVETARSTDASMVVAEMLPESVDFPVPERTGLSESQTLFIREVFGSHERVRLAARPAPWLLLVDTRRIAALGHSFAVQSRESDVPEGLIVLDVGAAVYEAASAAGLNCVVMEGSFQDAYHHYGGLSWVPIKGRRGLKKCKDLLLVRRRVWTERRIKEASTAWTAGR